MAAVARPVCSEGGRRRAQGAAFRVRAQGNAVAVSFAATACQLCNARHRRCVHDGPAGMLRSAQLGTKTDGRTHVLTPVAGGGAKVYSVHAIVSMAGLASLISYNGMT